MRTFSRRSAPALVLAVLLFAMAGPLAADPIAGDGSTRGPVSAFVEWIFESVVELLVLEVPAHREKGGEPCPTAETADEGPTGQAELGGSIDPNG